MDKKTVASTLEEMGTLLELQGANPFKSRAFHNASRAVEGITEDLAALVEADRLTEVKGIGLASRPGGSHGAPAASGSSPR